MNLIEIRPNEFVNIDAVTYVRVLSHDKNKKLVPDDPESPTIKTGEKLTLFLRIPGVPEEIYVERDAAHKIHDLLFGMGTE